MSEPDFPTHFKFDTRIQRGDGSFFLHSDWSTSSQGLAMQPEEGSAFGISFGIYRYDREVEKGCYCFIWHKQADEIECTKMGKSKLDLTRDFAVQGLTLMSSHHLLKAAQSIIRKHFPQFPHGEIIRFTVCAKGILIMPLNIERALTYGDLDQMLVARVPDNLSQHERLSAKINLEACASALIGHQRRHSNLDISVSIDVPGS